jgi:hypothetical protein
MDEQPNSEPDPFAALDPKDGFHVRQVALGDVRLALYVDVWGGGNPVTLTGDPEDAASLIAAWDYPSPRDGGECRRLYLALDALARYFTTGGDWASLDAALAALRRAVPGGIVYPGYHYVEGYFALDGHYQHVFAKDDGGGQAVVWEEPNLDADVVGGQIWPSTLEEINRQQEQNATEPPGAEDGEADPLRLRHREECDDPEGLGG